MCIVINIFTLTVHFNFTTKTMVFTGHLLTLNESAARDTVVSSEMSARRRILIFLTMKLVIRQEEEESMKSLVVTKSILRSPKASSPLAVSKRVSFSCTDDSYDTDFPTADYGSMVSTDDDDDESCSSDYSCPSPPSLGSPLKSLSSLSYIKQLRMGARN